MKKIIPFIVILLTTFVLGSCIKNDPVLMAGQKAEFDATTTNNNALSLTYPILGRIPGYGRVANTLDSTLRRYPQTVKLRINLIGRQSTKSETVGYEIFTSPITTFSMPATITGQTPSASAATLTVTDAVVGTHFTSLSGTVTIPANSSFGFIDLVILNPGATASSGRFIGLRLNEKGSIQPAFNYRELGLVIDQR
jgi:hypothetical protein